MLAKAPRIAQGLFPVFWIAARKTSPRFSRVLAAHKLAPLVQAHALCERPSTRRNVAVLANTRKKEPAKKRPQTRPGQKKTHPRGKRSKQSAVARSGRHTGEETKGEAVGVQSGKSSSGSGSSVLGSLRSTVSRAWVKKSWSPSESIPKISL